METAPKPADSTLNNNPQNTGGSNKEQEQDLVVWTAPSRPFKRHGRKFYVTTFSMAGIICLVVLLAEGVMPVILIISLIFLYYILSTVQPENVEYKITNRGFKIAEKETPWEIVLRFYFLSKAGSEVLLFDLATFPGKMELVINPETKEQLKKEISAFAPYEEVLPSAMEKITGWIAKKLPDD